MRARRPLRKGSITHSFVDQQISILHKAMAEKIVDNPSLVEQVKLILEERLENGTLRYGAFLTWQCILEHVNDKDTFVAAVLEDSPLMKKYRRKTPFVGILSEEERQQALLSLETN